MTPEEILHEAADIIRRDGWHQGSLDDGDKEHGAVCAVGAIDRAWSGNSQAMVEGNPVHYPVARRPAIERLMGAIGHQFIGTWNDAASRTVEDVLLALKQAAE